MAVTTQKFIRKPLYVDAVRVTQTNFQHIADWCQGSIQDAEVPGEGTGKQYIKVRVHNPKHPRQTKAFVGDWLLYTERGYKVYTNKAFRAAFDIVEEVDRGDLSDPRLTGDPATDRTIESAEVRSIGPVLAEPGIGTGVGEITRVESPAMAEARRIVEADGGTVVEATPNSLMEEARRQDALRRAEEASPRDIAGAVLDNPDVQKGLGIEDAKVVPSAAEGKRVLSVKEQSEMTADEVRELVQSGEAVLVQDLALPTS